MRIGGLASGMDTESIISDLMKANRMPLEKITQKKSYLEYQLNDYRSINRDLQASIYKLNDTILKPSTFTAKTVSISNADAVSIKGAGSTSDFSGSIAIGQLATEATFQSADKTGIDLKQMLSEVAGIADNAVDGKTSISISAMDKNGELVAKEFEFDINTDTIESVLKKINNESGVSAFYDTRSGQFSISAKNTGTQGDPLKVDISITGDIAKHMGIDDVAIAGGTTRKQGQDAKFTINGLETTRSSNTFEINGFEVALKQVTGTPTNHGTPVTFSSTTDTDKVMDSVVQFVNDYNKMIEELNAKMSESKYRDFPALSNEQKKDMKENEIKLWEEKAMSGTLRNDPIISSMLTQMRSAMNSNDKGGLRLSDMGITTTKNYLDNGKLVIDEAKLRKAITEDPTKVSQVFARPANGDDKGGVAVVLRDAMTVGQKAIGARAGSVGAGNSTFTLGRTLKGMDEQISRFEDRLKMTENRLWKQFSAMEQAISRANAQSGQLMSILGGGM